MPMSDKKEKTKANVSGFHTRNFSLSNASLLLSFLLHGLKKKKKVGNGTKDSDIFAVSSIG